MPDFVCVGDTTRDLFLFVEDAVVNNGKLELGYGQKIPVKQTAWALGGNAANVSVGLSRLGISTALVTVFGDDDRGAWIKRVLMENGVELGFSATDQKRQSNLSAIIVFDGERTILTYHSVGEKQIGGLPDSAWLYLTSAPGQESQDIFAKVLAKKQARAETKVAFNPNIADIKKGVASLSSALKVTDVLLLNREEAVLLLGLSPQAQLEDLARKLTELGPKTVAITDGPAGASVLANDEFLKKPAVGGKAFETTGAGDAFSSGFLAAVFRGEDMETALDWGLKNSGSVIQKIGAIEGLLTKNGINGKTD